MAAGCCFVMYAKRSSAEEAIHRLHNIHTLPSWRSPLQISFAKARPPAPARAACAPPGRRGRAARRRAGSGGAAPRAARGRARRWRGPAPRAPATGRRGGRSRG
jgi:hypothetical protein